MAKKIMRAMLVLCLGIVTSASMVSLPVQAQRNNSYQPPPRQYQPPPPQRQPQHQQRGQGQSGGYQQRQPGFQQPNTYRPSQVQQNKRDDTINRLKAAQGKGLENTARSGTAGAIREKLQKEGKLGTTQSQKDERPATAKAVTTLNRPLTPGEIQRGFTGKVTPDGKALIKFRGRIVTVPASRISGLSAKLAKQNENRRTAKWSEQQGASISQRIAAIAAASVRASKASNGISTNTRTQLMSSTSQAAISARLKTAQFARLQAQGFRDGSVGAMQNPHPRESKGGKNQYASFDPAEILAPHGKPIGESYGRSSPGIRTVSPREMDELIDKLKGMGAVLNPSKEGYRGKWFDLPDGKGSFGIRISEDNGKTIDVEALGVSGMRKIHQK
ncbi:TPA: hypothetical protein N2C61_006464 [Pseudomonas aeruginosa]|uniref:hypothetical protein n=1 Tax=Alcaligenes xylosoxydans xylosoxydans TaxID=85698 RepID=UPI000A8C8D23|nr:hypothetical protein [Achromobacter xylosoxidans]HCL4135299.1 hypothetical protein [Pseudomonas aeruginosa]